MRQVFSCPLFSESKSFQSVFISCFLKRVIARVSSIKRWSTDEVRIIQKTLDLLGDKLWTKYGFISPVSPLEKHQKVIDQVQAAASSMMSIPRSKDIFFGFAVVDELTQLMELLNHCIPLEYLGPINQLRVLIFVSTLVFSTEDYKDQDYRKLFVHISSRVWTSVRSVWLFNFVTSSDYIYRTMHCLQSDLDDRASSLLTTMVGHLYLMNNCAKSLSDVTELVAKLHRNEWDVSPECILHVLTILLHKNESFVKKITNNAKFVEHSASFTLLSTQTIPPVIYKVLKAYLDSDQNVSADLIYPLNALVTLLQHKVLFNMSSTEELSLSGRWKKLITKFVAISTQSLSIDNANESSVRLLNVLVDNQAQLSAILGDDFSLSIWNRLLEQVPLSEAAEKYFAKLSSSTYWKKVLKSESKCLKMSRLVTDLVNDLEGSVPSVQSIQPLVTSLGQSSSVEQFEAMFDSCLKWLHNCSAPQSVLFIELMECLCQGQLSEAKCAVIKTKCPTVFTILINWVFLSNDKMTSAQVDTKLKIQRSALHLCRCLLFQLVTHDQLASTHVYLAYNLLTEVNIAQYTQSLAMFSQLFPLINQIVFELNSRRPHLAMFSMSTQINLIVTLLLSLLKASDLSVVPATQDHHNDHLALEGCCRSLAKTLNHLARMDDVTQYSLHLIAHYLTGSQNMSILEGVKQSLTSALFVLINSIKDQQVIDQFYSRLNEGCRQVFKVMLEHYDKYHRFKGYV